MAIESIDVLRGNILFDVGWKNRMTSVLFLFLRSANGIGGTISRLIERSGVLVCLLWLLFVGVSLELLFLS